MATRTTIRRGLGALLLALVGAAAAGATPPPWPFTSDFSSYLLHVHPEVNYALHPEWSAAWERERLRSSSFRGIFGSSATDELLIDAHWALVAELAPGLRLRQDLVWLQRRHLPFDRLDLWLGLEQRLWRGFAVVVQTVPAERKEEIDLRLGGLWASDDRARYVQLLYVLEDLVHDQKDRRRGETTTAPRGVDWLARLEHGPWTLYSQGRWVRGFAREYPDAVRSPDLAAHRRAANEFTARVRWQGRPRTALEASWFQAEDAERKDFRNEPAGGGYDYDYAGWYRLLSLRGLVPVSDRWRLRAELHRLHRRAAATGWRAFAYRREETMPALFAEWAWGARRTVELGYLGTFYRWRWADGDGRRGFADKVELALVLRLAGEAALKLSVSHEVSLERFGGGSLRLLTGF
jgi:hypothetical protein